MFLLHLAFASGLHQTLRFPTAFDRSLVMITLAGAPVVLTMSLEER